MNPIENAIARPFPEVIIDRAMWRKILWQLPPLATRAIEIANGVEYVAHVCVALTSARASRRDHRLDVSPLIVGHITRITFTPRLVRLAMFFRPHGSPRLPRIGCHRQNHRRFLSFKNFLNRLLEPVVSFDKRALRSLSKRCFPISSYNCSTGQAPTASVGEDGGRALEFALATFASLETLDTRSCKWRARVHKLPLCLVRLDRWIAPCVELLARGSVGWLGSSCLKGYRHSASNR